jgi:N-methylhydantoinase B/oxoprolinase/acetone carboxylase alpha subunit
LKGGLPGRLGKNRHWHQGKWKEIPGKVTLVVENGDIIGIQTPGGGGYGKPNVKSDEH